MLPGHNVTFVPSTFAYQTPRTNLAQAVQPHQPFDAAYNNTSELSAGNCLTQRAQALAKLSRTSELSSECQIADKSAAIQPGSSGSAAWLAAASGTMPW